MIEKYDQNGFSAVDHSIPGQPPCKAKECLDEKTNPESKFGYYMPVLCHLLFYMGFSAIDCL
jgi:hypothetical protein